MKITRTANKVRITLTHSRAQKASLSAYDTAAKRWNAATRIKTTPKRATWLAPTTSSRVNIRIKAKKSGSLSIPGTPTRKPTQPIADDPNPHPKEPTPTPTRKAPPGPAPWEGFDWDDWDWEEFRCDYEAAKTYPVIDARYLYQIFCDPHHVGTGMSGTTIRSAALTQCTSLAGGARGAAYEVTYTYPLSDIDLYTETRSGTTRGSYYWWGRSNIQAHDIVPGSAHLDSHGNLAYTVRTRSIPDGQTSFELTLPFYDSRPLGPERFDRTDDGLTTNPEHAYRLFDTSTRVGTNVNPVASWKPVATYFRPATWERDVWGVAGVNGRTQVLGKPSGVGSSWFRENNASVAYFSTDDIYLDDYATKCGL